MLTVVMRGTLIADPSRLSDPDASCSYARAVVRVPGKSSDALLISVSAYGDTSEALLQLRKGDGITVTGEGRFELWQKKKTQHHGLNILVDRILRTDRRPGFGSGDGHAGANTSSPTPQSEEGITL